MYQSRQPRAATLAVSLVVALGFAVSATGGRGQVFPPLAFRPPTPAIAPSSSPVAPAFPAVSGAPAPAGLAVTGSEAFEVVLLKYADVSEIAGLLSANQGVKPNDNFMPEEPAFGSSGLQGGYYGGTLTTPVNAAFTQNLSQGEEVGRAIDDSIGIDRRLNAIVLKGTPEHVAQLKRQIAQLDVPVAASVVLETVFVELTTSGARNLGIDFNNANGQVATAAYTFAGGDFPGVANTAQHGGRLLNLQAAVYAQVDKGEGRIISRPRIAAQSGSTARIVTGDALPILTAIALSGVNAVQQQVQYVNVGVTLQIAPRVSEDGYVTSHIFSVVSSVTGYSQGYPTISQREASTVATVRDGESFVIGGLTQENQLGHTIKLPGLGDVPVLGRIFRVTHATRAKTELYVLVTPHVMRMTAAGQPPKLPPLP